MTEGIKIQINGEAGLQKLFHLAATGDSEALKGLPFTQSELADCALTIQNTWKNWAMGNSIQAYATMLIPPCPKPDSKLADSIKQQKTGVFEYTIFSDHPLMAQYQNGEDYTIDMKAPNSPWLNGKKSRLNKKDGSPYLIVPFSWGTGTGHFRNVVPAGIQKALRSRALSSRLPTMHAEPNARGEDILRHEYNWGGRVSEDEAQHTDKNGNLTGYDAGMVRMEDSAYKNGNHGTYFTFRVISAKADADKWIQHRHREGIDFKGELKKQYEYIFNQRIAEAMRADWERFQGS